MTMKFVRKCPKCGGEVQTKNLRKSIGLGFVDIPVAQFCLNPRCDWYQDFSEAAEAEDIKEDTIQIRIPEIKKRLPAHVQAALSQKETRKNLTRLGWIILVCLILVFLLPVIMHPPAASQTAPAPQSSIPADTPQVTSPTPTAIPEQSTAYEPKTYTIKMDVKYGFNPPVRNINRSDTVVWNNEESRQIRIYLISKESLFEKKLLQYTERASYQFNQTGKYTFVLAEYNSLNEFPNTTGTIIVT